MDWLALTFISTFSRAVYGVMTKALSSRMEASVYTQALLLLLAGAFFSLLVSPLLGGLQFSLMGVSVIAIILAVVSSGLGNIIYFVAIKDLTSGTAQIAFSSILLFNTILALLFFGLHLTPLNVLGLFLLMLAIVLAVTGRIKLSGKGVALMVLSAFLFSIFQLMSAEISKQMVASMYLLVTYLGAAVVVFTCRARVIIKDLSRVPKKFALRVLFFTALPSVGNFLFAYYAYRSAPEPTKVAMLLTSQVVLTIFLSYFFLKEKGHFLRKALAAILVVVSAVLIKG